MKGTLLYVAGLIVLTSVCDTINHLGLKICVNAVGMEVTGPASGVRFVLRVLRMPLAWISILVAFLSLFLWLYVLTMADLSLAFSLDSFHHVLIAIASWAILKERVTPQRWLGTSLIIAGIILVALSGTG
ncbi:MAG: EamA family transporter [Opitutaceae bacterium]